MKRTAIFSASVVLLSLAACDDKRGPLTLEDVHLQRFDSCRQMDKARTIRPQLFQPIQMAPSAQSDGSAEGPLGETNVQVAGVDEMDVAKADGENIYRITNTGGLQVLRRSPAANASVLQTLSLRESEYPSGIFVTADRVILLSSTYFYGFAEGVGLLSNLTSPRAITPAYEDSSKVSVRFYLRSSSGTLTLEGERLLEGSLTEARMTGSKLHLVVSRYLGSLVVGEEGIPAADLLPVTSYGKGSSRSMTACEKVLHEPAARNPNDIGMVMADNLIGVLSLDVEHPGDEPQGEFIAADYAAVVYASPKNIYLATAGWDGDQPVHQFALASDEKPTRYVGSGLVGGDLLNSFAMDEYEGHLRLALTRRPPMEMNPDMPVSSMDFQDSHEIAVLELTGGDLPKVGEIKDLAKGENIYAVRFLDERGFVVTFKKIDPLFAIDLSNPREPRVRGELKIPGFSTYLHPMAEGYLLGIGKDAEAALESDDFAWYQGMAMSIFDVRDLDNPRLLHRLGIGSRGTQSEALYDHHAFRYIPEKGLVVLPIDLYEGSGGQSDYGTWTFSGFKIYQASVASGFAEVGSSSFPGGEVWGWSSGNRSFFHNNDLSLVGGSELVVRSADEPDQDVRRVSIE